MASIDLSSSSTLKNHTVPAAPYSYRAPSPPFILIPTIPQPKRPDHDPLDLLPSYDNVDPSQLTSQDLAIITGNATQVATDRAVDWAYEQRREAQPILDFLYLGPTSVIRDHGFLQRQGITMLVVIRDARLARGLISVEKASAALGLTSLYLDVETPSDLIRAFPNMVRQVNNHLLGIYHNQAQGRNEAGQILVESTNFRRGKVLVTCETGNDRSAAFVAAYVMAVFGKDLVTTLQFINIQRFCCGFDEETKRTLLAWQDIIRARSQVAMHSRIFDAAQSQTLSVPFTSEAKRGHSNMMATSGDADELVYDQEGDRERFLGREPFVPFMDLS